MKTVQVAIQDPEYADTIRNLLLRDGGHRVHVVERPDMTLGGVIVMEAAQLPDLRLSPNVRERLVVMVRKERDDLSMIWDAGVRHVLFHGDPPHIARVLVLGVELSLGSLVLARLASFHPAGTAADTQKSSNRPLITCQESTKPARCRVRRAQPRN
jgi:hypothetical protein